VTEEQKLKLAALLQEERDNHKEMYKTIAEMLRLVLQVLNDRNHKDRAALPAVLRDLISMLEKDR
jgi:hypothetical protein